MASRPNPTDAAAEPAFAVDLARVADRRGLEANDLEAVSWKRRGAPALSRLGQVALDPTRDEAELRRHHPGLE
jgi:hypothetical protein